MLSAAGELFGAALVPVVYCSVNMCRTLHPKTTVVPSLPAPMMGPFVWCLFAWLALYLLLLAMRVALEKRRVQLDSLYLALED